MRAFYDSDADLSLLKGKTVAVIGYGSQGRAQALNLRDSGAAVVVGLPQTSASRKNAREDGLAVSSTEEAGKRGDFISLLVPDQLHQKIFQKSIRPYLTPDKTLVMAHGYSVHFRLIQPPTTVDTLLVAPLGPGEILRERFTRGKGIACLLAVRSKNQTSAWTKAKTYARAIGCTRMGAIATTFREEAVGDLFGEQAVLCGGLSQLLLAGFETLVKNGINPESAYLECVQQIDLIMALIKRHGLRGMFQRISATAAYGAARSGRKVIDHRVRRSMQQIFTDIASGRFARNWQKTFTDRHKVERLLETASAPVFERAHKRVQALLRE